MLASGNFFKISYIQINKLKSEKRKILIEIQLKKTKIRTSQKINIARSKVNHNNIRFLIKKLHYS